MDTLTTDRPGGDFMVDVLKSLNIEYVASNPGSSFRGIHESIINYGGNKVPEFLTCCHEESSVAMAHAYFKVEGKPMAVLCHGTVGLQHAAMGIYNAYCDRVPVYILAGNSLDATMRRPGVEWAHSVQDAASMVRDFIKWDDNPISLPHFAESAVRAYKIAMTPPMMPVVVVIDGGLQEDPIPTEIASRLRVPKLTTATPPQGDSGAVAEAARLLVNAQNPVIVADRLARTPAGITKLVELAEALQAPVVDQHGRMNFPSRHPLNQSESGGQLIANADVILGLELTDFWGTVNAFRDSLHRSSRSRIRQGTRLISITAVDLFTKSNFQDFQRYPEVDVAMAADAEATLPALTEAVRKLTTADRRTAFAERRTQVRAGARAREGSSARRSGARVGGVANQHGTDGCGDLGSDSQRRLVARVRERQHQRLGVPPVGLRQALSASRRLRRRRRRLRCSGGSGRRACQQETRAALDKHPGRRRYVVRAWRAVDRGASSDSAAHGNAQQPRLSPGSHAHPAHGEPSPARHHALEHRNDDREPNVDFAKIAQGMGVYAEGPSQTRRISVRRFSVRLQWSRRASRRSSTWSRSRASSYLVAVVGSFRPQASVGGPASVWESSRADPPSAGIA